MTFIDYNYLILSFLLGCMLGMLITVIIFIIGHCENLRTQMGEKNKPDY